MEKPRAGRNSRAISKMVTSTWKMTEELWATKARVCSYSLVTIWKGRELLCREENPWSQCICYFSVAVTKHHNQKQNKKGRVYFGLRFQNKKTSSSCSRKQQSLWQEQETARSHISRKHKEQSRINIWFQSLPSGTYFFQQSNYSNNSKTFPNSATSWGSGVLLSEAKEENSHSG